MTSNQPQQNKEGKSKMTMPSADSLIDYFKNHVRETTAYVLLVVGILLLFFDPLYGGLIVGIVSGIYFGDGIVAYLKQWKKEACGCSSEQITHHVICLGLAVAFFIAAPAIYLGAAIAIVIQQLFANPKGTK